MGDGADLVKATAHIYGISWITLTLLTSCKKESNKGLHKDIKQCMANLHSKPDQQNTSFQDMLKKFEYFQSLLPDSVILRLGQHETAPTNIIPEPQLLLAGTIWTMLLTSLLAVL